MTGKNTSTKAAMTEHTLLERSKEQTVMLTVGQMQLFAKGHFAQLAKECMAGSNDFRGAFLVFACGSRSHAMVDAAVDAGIMDKLKGGISDRVYIYLWAHMHDDLMWLIQQSPVWQKGISGALPWKIILAERFHKSEWDSSLARLLSEWEPSKLTKYPHALKYMVNPSERHILEAACGKDSHYMNPQQIDAVRPGASQWFKTRKALGLDETESQAKHAFRQWWKQGVTSELQQLDGAVFEPATSP